VGVVSLVVDCPGFFWQALRWAAAVLARLGVAADGERSA
jgi:hypothetical protein